MLQHLTKIDLIFGKNTYVGKNQQTILMHFVRKIKFTEYHNCFG